MKYDILILFNNGEWITHQNLEPEGVLKIVSAALNMFPGQTKNLIKDGVARMEIQVREETK